MPDEPSLEPLRRERTARAADSAIVAEAYQAYHEELFGFLLRATRERETAEDFLQEAYLRLLREANAGRPPEDARSWLYRVASNLVISRARRRTVAARWLNSLARRDSVDAPELDVLGRERSRELEALLAQLSPDARVGLLLAAHGLSGRAVAQALGRSEAATRTLLCRARLRLRELAEAEGLRR